MEVKICSVALFQRSSDPFRGFISLSGDAHEERYIRAHVMKDYLRQKRKSSKPGDTSPAASKLSDHLIQYRSDALTSTSAPAPRKMRVVMLKDRQGLRDVVSPRSLADSILCDFPSPINTSPPGTLALLEYYHHSFSDNSLAANLERKWMSVAISDPAMSHATLCLVALQKAQTCRGPQANAYF